jgi:putative MATE family efflux protein
MIISSSLATLGPTIDMIWVGRLGAASIAGVGVAGMIIMLVMMGRMGINMGTRALITRFVGAGDEKQANHVAQQAFVISGTYSVVMAAAGIFFAEPILSLFGIGADVIAEGTAYMRIMFIGSAAMSFRLMADGIMQASGDTMTPMKIAFLFRFSHIALCPFLIFGWWIFPRLGVSGAAITNVFSQSLGTALGLWVLFSGRTRLRLTLRNFHLDSIVVWRIVKVGIPGSIMGIQRSLGNLVVMWFMAPFGTLAVAAHTLGQRVERFLFIPGMGFGMGAGVLAGQNLGAQQPGRAEKSGWLAAGLVMCFMLITSVAILLWAESIIRIFSPEPDLAEIASNFLRIAAAGYIMMGFNAVYRHFLSGAGDTLSPMVISILMIWVVQMPLAFLLPEISDLGMYGVRWAIVAGMVVGAIAYISYFRMGRWKRKKV